MNQRSVTRVALLAVTALCSACGAFGIHKAPPLAMDPAEQAMVDTARDVAKAWSRSSMRSTPSPTMAPQPLLVDSSPLRQRVDISWFGDLVPAIQSLAAACGFDVTSVGLQKGPPIVVVLEATGEEVVNLLRQAGEQAGNRADVIVHEREKRIEVVHRD